MHTGRSVHRWQIRNQHGTACFVHQQQPFTPNGVQTVHTAWPCPGCRNKLTRSCHKPLCAGAPFAQTGNNDDVGDVGLAHIVVANNAGDSAVLLLQLELSPSEGSCRPQAFFWASSFKFLINFLMLPYSRTNKQPAYNTCTIA